MREYKFRAWDGREMFNVDVLAISPCTWDCPDHGRRGVSLAYQPHIKVMQFTGLRDKNGVEIYGGDIVSVPYTTPMGDLTEEENWRGVVQSHYGQYVVCYVSGGAHIPVPKALTSYRKASNVEEYISNYGSYRAPTSDTILTIVGNICENPELLEVEK